jgi:hypothetical protein
MQKKKRGRPAGSKNKPAPVVAYSIPAVCPKCSGELLVIKGSRARVVKTGGYDRRFGECVSIVVRRTECQCCGQHVATYTPEYK